MKSTTDKIATLLLRGRPITQLQALNAFGCMRLAARVHDLRQRGMDIETKIFKTPNGAKVAR